MWISVSRLLTAVYVLNRLHLCKTDILDANKASPRGRDDSRTFLEEKIWILEILFVLNYVYEETQPTVTVTDI